jgi:hypothetical protein
VDALWVSGGSTYSDAGRVGRIDPRTHGVTTITTPESAGVVGAGQDLWLVGDHSIQRADPTNAAPIGARLDVAVGPMAVTPTALWLLQQPDSTKPSVLQEIDPTLLQPVGPPLTVGLTAVAVAATAQTVWVANFNAGTLSMITLGQ